MRHDVRNALTVTGAATAVPIVLLAWAAPLVSAAALIAAQRWTLLAVGLVAAAAAFVCFGLLLRFVPITAKRMVNDLAKAIVALKVLRAGVFLLMLLYAFYVFRLALTEGHAPLWLRGLWAYATIVTPFTLIGIQGRNKDPMVVIWPAAAGYGTCAALIALRFGETPATIAQSVGSLVGLYFGWRLGTQRVLSRLFHP